jgi:prepilin-type N-terminal cleavage/methylation domain-containing protein
MRQNKGITLIELLVTISILGGFLTVISATLFNSQRLTSQQAVMADTRKAMQLGFLRMSEIIKQSSYIYTANRTISLNSPTFTGSRPYTIGNAALAVLVPEGSTYCNNSTALNPRPQTYCGFMYSIENRNSYENILGASPTSTNFVLIEWRVTGINWPQNAIPTTSWNNATSGIIVDSVAFSNDGSATSLGDAANFQVSTKAPSFDKSDVFNGTVANSSSSIIESVQPRIVISYGGKNQLSIVRNDLIFAQAIPRGTLPNPN